MATKRARPITWRLLILGGLVIGFLASVPTLGARTAGAQGASTPAPVTPTTGGQIVVLEPELAPPFRGDAFPGGWLRITGKSAYIVYVAMDQAAGAAAREFSGSWRPGIVEPGYYRVEAYSGAWEIREYRELFPATLPADLGPTESAVYTIHHADGMLAVDRSQNQRESAWIDLGTYLFATGTDGFVELSNQTDDPAGSIVAFSAVRFLPVEPPATVTPSPLPTEPPPTGTAPPTTPPPTAAPTETPAAAIDPSTALGFGELVVTSGDERVEAEAQILLNDVPVGVMDISYPTEISPAQAENILVDIVVTGEFTSTLTLAVRDLTQEEDLDPLLASTQFFLTLDARTLEYDDETQRVSVQARREAGAAWNVTPREGVAGEQPFNIKVVLNITDGIPELSGPPLSFSLDVLASAPLVSPTPDSTDEQAAGSLSIFWYLLLLLLLVLILFYILWRRRGAPVALRRGIRWSALRRGILTILEDQFSRSEFESLCFNLGVEHEDLRGEQRVAKMQALVAKLERHNRMPQLVAALAEVDQARIIDWTPIQTELLAVLIERSSDDDFRSQLKTLANEFSDESFRSDVVELLDRLAEDETRRRFGEQIAAADDGIGEEGRLLGRLRQQMSGNVNIPELVTTMAQADKDT